MKFAISRLSVCPIRLKPSDASEMVSQLLFGEHVELIDKHKSNWVKVRCVNDDYVGWMDPKQLLPVNDLLDTQPAIALEMSQPIWCDGFTTYITVGAELPDFDGMTAKIDRYSYRYSGQALDLNHVNRSKLFLEKLVKKWLNVPYLWGGRSPFGVDCSGFTQVVYKCLGFQLKRDSIEQAEQGEAIDFINLARSGDLAFFSKASEKITHVGIMLNANKIIHASGSVRIDTVDHYGIFNEELQEYTHRLKIIKRNIEFTQSPEHE